ncbi:DUF4286 family protein [Luteimonas sp. SX5]|uniref:DUF4286 family protein n=1 Tax=Luteimonas galliterrae TaxID=2940486 RepID=A0ABT0MJC2_9GAMM|nr:DUF4286 family protein [Luteimonas galliterrae]MCL1634968.1 DUF4286 family protein [Luteimonas galliterrae]
MTQQAPPGHIVYEVNVEVDAVLADDYRAWMDTHVREMVSLPGFFGAYVHNVLAPAPPAGTQAMSVQFFLRDTAALDSYLREHALRFRASSLQMFGDRFRTTRRVMRHTTIYDPER